MTVVVCINQNEKRKMSKILKFPDLSKREEYVLDEVLGSNNAFMILDVNTQLDVLLAKAWQLIDHFSELDYCKLNSLVNLLRYVFMGYVNPFGVTVCVKLYRRTRGELSDFSINITFTKLLTPEEIAGGGPLIKLLQLEIINVKGDEYFVPKSFNPDGTLEYFDDPKGETVLPVRYFKQRITELAEINSGNAEFIMLETENDNGNVYNHTFECSVPSSEVSQYVLSLVGPDMHTKPEGY